MAWIRWLGCVAVLWFGWALEAGAAKPEAEWSIAAKPSWVQPMLPTADPGYAGAHPSGGVAYETIDRQRRIVKGVDWSYGHVVARIVSEAGAEAAGQQSFEFSPPNERLILHSLQVRRGDEATSHLDAERVQVLQREANLEQRVYDNRRTAFILISDLRVGDVLEYEWSIVGGNPVLDGHVASGIQAQESVNVGLLFHSILSDHALQLRGHGGAPRLEEDRKDGLFVYTLRAESVAAAESIANVPAETQVVPWVQVSDFPDWGATARWGEALFTPPKSVAELRPIVAEIEAAGDTDTERTLAALEWVQSNVRYFSMPFAESTHRPATPQLVLERRFGDCKDKALLMVGLLGELGIDANVALVDTIQGRFIPELLPTSSAFNHAIVMADVDGRTVWLDPTASYQHGSLDDVAARGLHWALPLVGDSEGLVRVVEPSRELPELNVTSHYRSTSFEEPATLDVEWVYAGRWAETMRYLWQAGDPEQLATSVEYRQRKIHADAVPLGEFEYHADDERNLVTIKRSYRLPSFWAENENLYESTVAPYALFESNEEVEPGRQHPLGLTHPFAIEQHIIVSLHTDFDIEPAASRENAGGIEFEYEARGDGQTVYLDWEYRTTTHRVEFSELEEYRRVTAAMDKTMSYQLWSGVDVFEGEQTFNWSMFVIAMLWGALLSVGAAFVVWKKPYLPRPSVRYDPNLVGLGGWLALVGIGLVLSPLRLLFDLFQTLPSYSNEAWAALAVPGGASYDAMWAPTLLFELFANVVLVVVSVLALVTYFRKSRSFPLVFLVRQALLVGVMAIDNLLISMLPDSEPVMDSELQRTLAIAAVWTVYILVSVRVRSTFLPPPDNVSPPEAGANPPGPNYGFRPRRAPPVRGGGA